MWNIWESIVILFWNALMREDIQDWNRDKNLSRISIEAKAYRMGNL